MTDTIYGDFKWYEGIIYKNSKYLPNISKVQCGCGNWSDSCQEKCNPCKSPSIIGTAVQNKWPDHSYAQCLSVPIEAGDLLSGRVKPVSVDWAPGQGMQYSTTDNSNRIIRAVYKLSDFDSWDKVVAFYNQFAKDSTQFDKLMLHFISNVASTDQCDKNPLTGEERKRCSQIFSSSSVGQFCQKWYTNTSNKNKDIIAKIFCEKFPGLPECDCINRSSNKIYKALKQSINPFQDCCWWAPCANPSKFFVLAENQGPQCGKGCPKTICQNVVEAIDGGKVVIGIANNYVSCNTSGDNTPTRPLWERVLMFVVPLVFFVGILLIYDFPQVKEFIRVYHVAFGLGLMIVLTISAILIWNAVKQ